MKKTKGFNNELFFSTERKLKNIWLTSLMFFVGLLVSFSQAVDDNKDRIEKSGESKHLSNNMLVIPCVGYNNPDRPDSRGLVLFVDWFSVRAGDVGYGAKGVFLTQNELESKGVGHQVDVPRGVELVVQEAETYGPVLQADKPWEGMLRTASVLRSDFGFKMWYRTLVTIPEEKMVADDVMAGKIEVAKSVEFLCYAESEDGFTWHKPELGLYEFDGSTANNIICEETREGIGEHTDNIFLDCEGNYRRLVSEGEPVPGGSADKAMYSYTSTDGIHWTLDGPVMDMMCDTQNNGFYDKLYGKYVLYVRYGRGARRTTAMTEGSKFNINSLPLPQVIFEPDPQDSPSLDFYTINYSRHPLYDKIDVGDPSRSSYFMNRDNRGRLNMIRRHDARDMHFMFPSVYHRDRDVIDVQLAISRDGRQWSRPERKAVIPCGKKDGNVFNSIYAFPELHTFNSGMWGVMYCASERAHNMGFVNQKETYKYYWATWEENRLVALQAKEEGMCTVELTGYSGGPEKEIRLNYQTEKYGWIRIELISNDGLYPPTGPKIIEGYSFTDCDPLVGDSIYQPVKWNGSPKLPSHANTLRIHMFRAKLFAIEWE